MTAQTVSKQFQRSILVYSTLAMLATGAIIALASILPLYDALKRDQQRNLRFALQTRILAVDEYLSGTQDIALQIASRTAIRRRLEAYNRGEVELEQLVSFGRPILEDALTQSQEVVGISRLDRSGALVIQVGIPIPEEVWPLPLAEATEAEIWPVPVKLGDRSYLVVGAPVNNRQGRRVGTDIVVFRLDRLQRIVEDYTGLGATGETILGTVYRGQVELFFPLRASRNSKIEGTEAYTATIAALETVFRQEAGGLLPETLGDDAGTIAYSAVNESPWGIAVWIHPEELYAPVKRQVAIVGGTIVLLILLGTGGMILLLQPLTGKLLLHNDELEQRIQAKTATLEQELEQRRQAEAALQTIRGELENRVAERILELKKMNRRLRDEVRDRVLVEAALRESEARYSSLTNDVLDTSAVGIFILDANFQVIWINQALEQFFGLQRDSVIGKDKRQLIRDRIQGIFADSDFFFSTVLATYDNNTYIENFECHVLPKENREERWLEHWSQPICSGIYAGGRIEHYTDVTERKQIEAALRLSEARLAGILDNAEEAIVSVNEYQQITLFNQGAEKIFGYTAQEILSQSLNALLPERFSDKHSHYIHTFGQSTATARLMGERNEIFGCRKDGTEFPMEASISQLDLAGQKIFTAILRDISERKQAEAEIAKRTAALERSNQELEQFAHVVSHDLQQPLQSIIGFARILTRAYPDLAPDKVNQYINRIVDASILMGQLIHDLLAYSQVNVHDRDRESIDCNIVLQRVIDNLKAAIDESGAEITTVPLPTVVATDETHLIQLFQNLISNAIKYHRPEDQPQVKISVEHQTDRWLFGIHDNGIGIKPEHRDRIFQIFQRLHTKQEYPGTGIGLATCKRIVECQGGQIWVDSELGVGTTFYFTHPC